MAEKEQIRPQAPSITSDLIYSDDDDTAFHRNKLRQRRLIKCCGCTTVVLVILGITIVVLMLTVFKVKDPIIKMNGISITKVELINGTILKPGSNLSVTADVSVKNPNIASFKYSNTTTALYIGETMIGEARGPPGKAKARRTSRMNITVNIMADEVMSNLNVSYGKLRMRSFSRIPGRVKLLKLIRRYIVVKMDCWMDINIINQMIEDQKCNRKVKL